MRDPKAFRFYPPPPEDWLPEFWDIKDEIGRGAVSIVYELFESDDVLNKALKLFNPDVRFHEDIDRLRKRFRLEQWLTYRFASFSGVMDGTYGEKDGQPYIIMARYNGNLKSEVRSAGSTREKRDRVELIRLALDLLDSLAFLHANGVVHRDLKPDNVLMRSPLAYTRYLLADFGIGLMLDTDYTKQTLTGDLLGSRDYVAPEQRKSPHEVTPAADIFSVGVILFEYATGNIPAGYLTRVSEVNPQLAWATTVVEEMMSQAIEHRPQSAPEARSRLVTSAMRSVIPKGSADHLLLPLKPLLVLSALAGKLEPGSKSFWERHWEFNPVQDALVFDDLLNYVCHALGETRSRISAIRPPSMDQPLTISKSGIPIGIDIPDNAMDILREEAQVLRDKYENVCQHLNSRGIPDYGYDR